MDPDGKKKLVMTNAKISIKKQCILLQLNRTTLYYKPKTPSQAEIVQEEYIKSRIDYWHTKMCFLGCRKLTNMLNRIDGINIGRKLVKRYMREIGICVIYPKPNLSANNQKHNVFPYLLRNLNINHPNHVWSVDITYIKMGKSHMYLTAIIDWYSRYIVGYELSDTLDTESVITALRRAIKTYGTPEIINSDQGCQFTSDEYINYLAKQNIRQSMDGKSRWADNVIIERWFRSLKCENIYINEYPTPKSLRIGIETYVSEYNGLRPHESLNDLRPADVYCIAA